MGVSESEIRPEISTATAMVMENSRSSRPMIPSRNSTGMNTATSEMVMEMMVKPTSRAPSKAASHARFAHLHVAHDVLQHDDRVIHHEAHRKRHGHHGKRVDGEAEQLHGGKGAEQRKRHGKARNDGGRDIPQEDENHQNDQRDGEQQREFHVVNRLPDVLRSVEFHIAANAGRHVLSAGWAAGA